MAAYSSVPLDPVHRDILAEAVDHLETGNPEQARTCLESLAGALDLERTPHQLAYLLSAGLARRLAGPEPDTNLYRQTFDVSHLDIYSLLRAKDPLFLSAYPIANEQLIHLMRGHDQVTLLDFGTGDGSQLVELVEELARRQKLPERLHVIAVDLAAAHLRTAETRLLVAARQAGCKLGFHAITRLIEELEEADWDFVAESPGALVVNATFTMHHIRHTQSRPDARDTLFSRLYALKPVGMVLCEPCADFNLPGFRERLRHAARFFGAMFCHLDELDVSTEERRLLKFAFWGREMLDILGNCEVGRCERFETPQSWLARLRKAGFVPSTDLESMRALAHPSLRTTANEGFVGLGTGYEALLAVVVVYSGDQVMDPAPPPRAPALAETALTQECESLDVIRYLKTLVSVARANGLVHVREREFVNGQACLAGVDPVALWGDPGYHQAAFLAPRATRDAVLRDCIALACSDGEYDEHERQTVHRLAGSFGVDPERIAELEAAAQRLAPPLLEGGPAWFRDYWMLQGKTTSETLVKPSREYAETREHCER